MGRGAQAAQSVSEGAALLHLGGQGRPPKGCVSKVRHKEVVGVSQLQRARKGIKVSETGGVLGVKVARLPRAGESVLWVIVSRHMLNQSRPVRHLPQLQPPPHD